MKQRGFLLFEVTLLLSILGLFSVFVLPKMSLLNNELSRDVVVTEMKKQLATTALLYKVINGDFPTGNQLKESLNVQGLELENDSGEQKVPAESKLVVTFKHKCDVEEGKSTLLESAATMTYNLKKNGQPEYAYCGKSYDL